MAKKFNLGAVLAAKRIKEKYEQAVEDLEKANGLVSALQLRCIEQHALCMLLDAKVGRQKAKLKRAGDRVGELIRLSGALHRVAQRRLETVDKALQTVADANAANDTLRDTEDSYKKWADVYMTDANRYAKKVDELTDKLHKRTFKLAYAMLVSVLANAGLLFIIIDGASK